MKAEDDDFVMSDGTKYSANCCIVGLSCRTGEIYGGYDQHIGQPYGWDFSKDWPGLPDEHRREIAEHMISLWTRFRDGWGGAYPQVVAED